MRAADLQFETAAERRRFDRVRRAERQYAVKLRKIAHHVGEIVKAFPVGDPAALPRLQATLNRYAEVIEPWARATGAAMLADVSRRDEKVWTELSKTMNRALREEIRKAPTGEVLRAFLNEQVRLITSLPREAGQRVHKLTLEGITNAERFPQVAEEILRSGKVTASRATLIARTEVARTSSGLTMARALHVGSDGYVWRTAMDADVRPVHRKLEGKFVKWDSPPIAGSKGERAHAGMIYNCRCYPEVVLPDVVR